MFVGFGVRCVGLDFCVHAGVIVITVAGVAIVVAGGIVVCCLAGDLVIIGAGCAGAAAAGLLAFALVVFLFLGKPGVLGFCLEQRLPVGHRDLVIVGMNFAERQEPVPVAAVFNECGLQRRFYTGDLGEVYVALQRAAGGGLVIELFDPVATHHGDSRLFRVGGVDKHLAGHNGKSSSPNAPRQRPVAHPGGAAD